MTCHSNGWTERHNDLRDSLSALLDKATVTHDLEPPCVGTNRRPADLLLRHFKGGRDVAVDITVTSCLKSSEYPLDVARARTYLAHAEREKVRNNQEVCDHMGWDCMGAAFSPWGGTGPAASELISGLLQKATVDKEGWPRQREIQRLAAQLSFTLFRHVARQLEMRCRVADLLP